MISKKVLIALPLSLSLSLVACAPNIDTAKANYCKALNNYAASINTLNSLTSSNTVEDYKKAESAANKAASALDKASDKVNSAEGKALSKLSDQYNQQVNSIKDSTSLAQADQQINNLTDSAMSQYVSIVDTTCTYGSDTTSASSGTATSSTSQQ